MQANANYLIRLKCDGTHWLQVIFENLPQCFRVLGNCSCIALIPSIPGHMLTPLTYIRVGERAPTVDRSRVNVLTYVQ